MSCGMCGGLSGRRIASRQLRPLPDRIHVDLRCSCTHLGASTTSGPDKAGLAGMDTEVSTGLSVLHARSSWAGSPVENQRRGHFGKPAKIAVLPEPRGRFITNWLEVRVLPGPVPTGN